MNEQPKDIKNWDLIGVLYVEAGYSMQDLANIFNVTPVSISKGLARNSFPTRDQGSLVVPKAPALFSYELNAMINRIPRMKDLIEAYYYSVMIYNQRRKALNPKLSSNNRNRLLSMLVNDGRAVALLQKNKLLKPRAGLNSILKAIVANNVKSYKQYYKNVTGITDAEVDQRIFANNNQ